MASKDPHHEEHDNCDHGNTGKECRQDPSPNGKDCDHHGNHGGVNEDHCRTTTTVGHTTTTTHKNTTTTVRSSTTTIKNTPTTRPRVTATTGGPVTTIKSPNVTATTGVTAPAGGNEQLSNTGFETDVILPIALLFVAAGLLVKRIAKVL